MSSIAFQTIEGRVAFVKEINFKQSLKLFLVLLRMYKKNYEFPGLRKYSQRFEPMNPAHVKRDKSAGY